MPRQSYPPPPYRAAYQPHRYLSLSRAMRKRARLAGGVSSLFAGLGFWMVVVGAAGTLGVTMDNLPSAGRTSEFGKTIDGFAAQGGWLVTVVAGGGFLVCVAGTMVGQLLLRSASMARTTGTAWWSSVLFNCVQCLGVGSSLVFLGPALGGIVAALIGSGAGWENEGIAIAMLVGGGLGVVVNVIVGWFVSGLLWWWMAHAHRPAMSP